MVKKAELEEAAEEEEARRLKTLAEDKYKESNLRSALKYAKRAQRLYSDLDGVSEMVTAFKILQTAGKSTGADNSPDWYKILQTEPFSHINTIKKQYRKLALILHPDKNSFMASEEAFKLVGDAFRCLSDKIRRKEYDMKLRIAIQAAATSAVVVTEETFWTACSTCRLLHQFKRRYIGHTLMCPRCKKSFMASEVDGEDARVRDGIRASSVGMKKSKDLKRKMSSVDDILERSRSMSDEKLGEVEKNGGGAELSEGLRSKRGRIGEEMTLAEMQLEAKRNALEGKMKVKLMEEKEKKEKEKEKERHCDDPKNTRDSIIETRSASKKTRGLEIESPRISCSKKGKDLVIGTRGASNKSKALVIETHGALKKSKDLVIDTRGASKKSKDSVIETRGTASKKSRNVEIETPQGLTMRKSSSSRNETRALKKSGNLEIQRRGTWKGGEFEIMTVEDSDFHDFDTDRVERSFKQGQVWAIYDDDDGMPRHYGLIDEVVSINPFELKMSWLDLQNSGDERMLYWEKLGFHISCGRFKVSKKTVINSVNFYSHVVDCERAAREIYRIYPKKGSIWALYKEEALDAEGRCSKDKRCYDIVVFLTSYSEMHGLSMAYLEKVDGFKTVFKRRETGAHAVRWFEKDDVRLFSHQIPARRLSGTEALQSRACWELDPASLPKELLTIAWER